MIKRILITVDAGKNFKTRKSCKKRNVDEMLRISIEKNVLQSTQKQINLLKWY